MEISSRGASSCNCRDVPDQLSWAEGCPGGRKLALLSLALLQLFLAACEPLHVGAMPHLASLPAAWTRSQAAAPCGLRAGARSHPDLLSVPWGHSCPCSSHLNSDTAPPVVPALLALSTWLIPLQPPHHLATGTWNVTLWILFPQKPTYLQEVAFPQLCQSDLPRPGPIDCVEYPLYNLQHMNSALETTPETQQLGN